MQSHLLPVFGPQPLLVERGDGCHLIDSEGRRYLDFITGIGVNALGYGHPAILEAIHAQASLCLHTSNLHSHRHQGELAAKLADWSGLDQVFFSNSGTEAMEAALKAARALANQRGPGRHRIIALENSFHGRSAGALSVTGQRKYRQPFQPLVPDTVFIPINDVDALRSAASDDTIAVVAETIQGEGGVHPLTPAFLSAIREVTSRREALWIADETQCGLGRTGHRFAYQMHQGLEMPDVVVTAKPLAGGLPMGATIFSRRAAAALETGMHGTTFGGGPLVCRTALAFLNEVDRLLPEIRRQGVYFQQQLRAMEGEIPVVRQVRGCGLMAGIELTIDGAHIVDHARAAGLVINCTHGNVLRLLPPFIVSKTEIEEACSTLRAVLTQ